MGKKYYKDCEGGDDCRDELHLCKIAKRNDMDMLRRLVKDPRYICTKCGRAAGEPSYLCRPDTL